MLPALRRDPLRFFEDLFGDRNLPQTIWGNGSSAFVPALDVRETKDSFVVEAELPGIRSEDLKVEVMDGMLCLRGERKQEEVENTDNYHRSERVYGSFERQISLPPSAELDKIQAVFENGVLRLEVPKKASAKPRNVTVQVKKGSK
jgi:HSP20 family protein